MFSGRRHFHRPGVPRRIHDPLLNLGAVPVARNAIGPSEQLAFESITAVGNVLVPLLMRHEGEFNLHSR